MTRESQVRICERLGVKFPGPTRPGLPNRNVRIHGKSWRVTGPICRQSHSTAAPDSKSWHCRDDDCHFLVPAARLDKPATVFSQLRIRGGIDIDELRHERSSGDN